MPLGHGIDALIYEPLEALCLLTRRCRCFGVRVTANGAKAFILN
jgi:hypothetical protein